MDKTLVVRELRIEMTDVHAMVFLGALSWLLSHTQDDLAYQRYHRLTVASTGDRQRIAIWLSLTVAFAAVIVCKDEHLDVSDYPETPIALS